jgi:hypothetical protein
MGMQDAAHGRSAIDPARENELMFEVDSKNWTDR